MTRTPRKQYQQSLGDFLEGRVLDLDEEDRSKATSHPLRDLDSKRRATQSVIAQAPLIEEFLDGDAKAHFERVQEGFQRFEHPIHDRTQIGSRVGLLHPYHL